MVQGALVLALALLAGCGTSGEEPGPDAGPDATFDPNATLAALTVSAGGLEPPFEPEIAEYDLVVLLGDENVTFTPTAAVAGTTITVDGVDVASGDASAALALAPGNRDVDVVVTAADGAATIYRVHVQRGRDELLGIELSHAGLGLPNPLSPGFDPERAAYDVEVGLWAQRLSVAVRAADPDATITIGGGPATSGVPSSPFTLNLGLTSIPIVVDAGGGLRRTYALDVTRGSAVVQRAYAKASNTGASDLFGTTVALFGDTLVVGAVGEQSAANGVNGNQSDNSIATSGAVYVFTRSAGAWTQQAYLKASNPGANDRFGTALGLWGDTLAVGAHFEDSAATGVDGNQADNGAVDSGAVYVFTRTGTTWSQQAYLKASNTDAGARFGGALALEGETLVVGARMADSGGVDGGAAYVFARAGSTWSQQARLIASDAADGDLFGRAVSLSGDTLAVGAYFADGPFPDSGAAYVFTRAGATWTEQARVVSQYANENDLFGNALAVRGDTLAVGAYEHDSGAGGPDGAPDSGIVYVFTRTGTTWTEQAYLKASNPGALDYFGSSVALWGDTLAIGAAGEASAATGIDGNQLDNTRPAGAVYVFTRAAGVWSQRSYVKPSNTPYSSNFGQSVALWGDTLAVGAFGESSAATGIDGKQLDGSLPEAGAVYLFR